MAKKKRGVGLKSIRTAIDRIPHSVSRRISNQASRWRSSVSLIGEKTAERISKKAMSGLQATLRELFMQDIHQHLVEDAKRYRVGADELRECNENVKSNLLKMLGLKDEIWQLRCQVNKFLEETNKVIAAAIQEGVDRCMKSRA